MVNPLATSGRAASVLAMRSCASCTGARGTAEGGVAQRDSGSLNTVNAPA